MINVRSGEKQVNIQGGTLHFSTSDSMTTSRVLDEYYQTVTSLSIYLQFLLPLIPYVHPHDTDSFHKLVSTKVAFNNSLDDIPPHAYYPPQCSQKEIMDRVHTSIFKNTKGKPSNVLTFGYPATSIQW